MRYIKSAITSQYIIEKVAPIFNKKGYVGTSLSDMTEATGLTKGSIYGNFKNKDGVAIEALKYNISIITDSFFIEIANSLLSPINRLYSLRFEAKFNEWVDAPSLILLQMLMIHILS